MSLPWIGITCGGGTYVRSLVRDLGKAVGTVAHMSALQRTRVASFGIDVALPRDRWTRADVRAAIAQRTAGET